MYKPMEMAQTTDYGRRDIIALHNSYSVVVYGFICFFHSSLPRSELCPSLLPVNFSHTSN